MALWLRILNSEHGDHLLDVAPFWAQRPAVITFTAGRAHGGVPGDDAGRAAAGPQVTQGCRANGAEEERPNIETEVA
ncbi:hypothetical protein [Streptomyces soliscabiei]|uniref:hypothetical protein n=1 Tax=Streptomyces soliscabiei TaxID=588897 RepID=UPI0029BCDF72|nr:hypothetical protein [Streptomyces sp. NY05-11A]MDX2683702.1 hypothetical protein [Streptomyces sp. NY05-11A]